ncbi:MAG: hypothetical protein ACK4OP_00495 [Gemmobacter sp.]
MLEAVFLGLCLNAYDIASVHASLLGLSEIEAALDEKEFAVGDALLDRMGDDQAGAIAVLQDGYRSVAAMSGADLTAQIERCDSALAGLFP